MKVIGDAFMAFGGRGAGKGQLRDPTGVAVGVVDGEEWLWVVDRGNARVQLFVRGRYVRSYAREGKAGLVRPFGAALLQKEQLLYVTDAGSGRVVVFGVDGTFVKAVGVEFREPMGIAAVQIGGVAMFVVVDCTTHRVALINKQGAVVKSRGGVGTDRRGQFNHPTLVAVDTRRKEIYVAERMERIQKLDYDLQLLAAYDLQCGPICAMHYDTRDDVLVVGSNSQNVCLFSQELLRCFVV